MTHGDVQRELLEEAVLVGVAVAETDAGRARKPGLPRALNTAVLPLGFCPPPWTVRGESLSVIRVQSQT